MASTLLPREKFKLHTFDGFDLGVESIGFQSRNLHGLITACVDKLRNSQSRKKYTTEDVKASGIIEVIREHVGFNCEFGIEPVTYDNAYVYMPSFDHTHPFFDENIRRHCDFLSDSGSAAVAFLDKEARGSVDLARSRVTGIFTKIPLKLRVTYGLLTDRRFTNQEIASIILHEVGHAFTYCYYLGHIVTGNIIVAHAARRIIDVDDTGERVKVLKRAEQVLGIEIPDLEKIASVEKTKLKDTVETVFIASHRTKYRSITGTDVYDFRTCEQLADHFSAMHGGAPYLATGLAKIYKKYQDPSVFGAGMYTLNEVIKFILTLPFLPFVLLAILCSNSAIEIYDRPKDRVAYLRKHINEVLKNGNLSDKEKKAFLEELAVIKKVEDSLSDRKTWFEKLNTFFNTESARRNNQIQNQKAVEELIFNDLFAQSAEISLIK
jgi:hypothetical protein